MLNRVVLIGRLTRQPELRITPSSTPVTTITLAVDRRPSQAGTRETDFIDVVLFGKLAETTCRYLDKGRQVAIEGRLQTRNWETKEGQKRKSYEVYADNIQFLARPQARPEAEDTYTDEEDMPLPPDSQ